MADELNKEQIDNNVNEANDTKLDTKVEQPKQEEDVGFKEKVVNFIKDKIGIGESGGAEQVGEESEVPDEFIDVAIKAGWADDDIIEFAKDKTKEDLLELVPHIANMTKSDKDESETKTETKTETTKTETDKTAKDDKDVDALLEKLLPKLQEKLGIKETQKVVDEIKADRDANSVEQTLRKTDDLMDELSREFPELGLRKNIPVFPSGQMKGQMIPTSPQFKARSELYGYAMAFMKIGQNIDEAVVNAANAYRGKNLKERTQREVIKDLKNHEKRLSGPRTAKDTKKTYANDREEGIDVVRDLLRQQGQEG